MKNFCNLKFSIVGNVVWDDDFTASRVLMEIGKDIQKPAGDIMLCIMLILSVLPPSSQMQRRLQQAMGGGGGGGVVLWEFLGGGVLLGL